MAGPVDEHGNSTEDDGERWKAPAYVPPEVKGGVLQAKGVTDLLEIGSEEQLCLLFAALAEAQGEIGAVTKSKTANAGSYSYKYGDIGDIIEAIKGPLAKHGLARFHGYRTNEAVRHLSTTIAHKGGGRLRTYIPLADLEPKGGRSAGQTLAAAFTAAKRLGLMTLLSLSSEETDELDQTAEERDYPPPLRQQSNRGRRDGQ